MPKLTEAFIAGFKPAEGQRDRMAFDTETRGLGVRAFRATEKRKDGSKVPVVGRVFVCQWTDPTTLQKRREPLGAWGSLTLEQARAAVRVRMGEVAQGKDPLAERRAKRAEAEAEREASRLTLRALLDQWARLGLKDRRESYRAEAVRAVSHAFARYLDKPAHHLSREMAVRVLDKLADAGKTAMAGRTMAYGRACYGWALKRERVPLNPFLGLPVSAGVTARDRVLSPEETGDIWRAAETLGWPFGPLVKVLLLTAQRREEVGGMRWSELSPDLDVWTIPASRAKNGMAHVVHLAPDARAILAELPRFAGSDLVFTTTGKTPVSGFSKAAERIGKAVASARAEAAQPGQQAAQMPSWRFHDFRRSAVTWLASAGFPPHVCDKLLNHVATTGLSDVARVYQRAAFLPERKAALEAWAKHVVTSGPGRDSESIGNVLRPEIAARRGAAG